EHDKSLADQLKRAAQSVVLNIAEGRGNDAGNAKARFSGPYVDTRLGSRPLAVPRIPSRSPV
ncbi:MAG: four helix bundle protein, partial [Planctomycetota bacterium]